MKKKPIAWIFLTLICIVAGLLLAATNEITEDPILEQAAANEAAARAAVLKADTFVSLEELLSDEALTSSLLGAQAPVDAANLGGDKTVALYAAYVVNAAYDAWLTAVDQTKPAEASCTLFNGSVTFENSGTVKSAEFALRTADWCYYGYGKAASENESPELLGYVAQITVQGFGGEVEVVVGFDAIGTVTGISVGGSKFSETAGLGAKAKEADFTSQFMGKVPELTVVKDGANTENEVDAITAATITSSAVTRGVNSLAKYVGAISKPEIPQTVEGVQAGDYTGFAKGFGGDVTVSVSLDGNGAILSLSIDESNFKETPSMGGKVLEASFQEQFIGLTPYLTTDDIDMITGATVTSTAVVDAVNQVMDKAVAAYKGEEYVDLSNVKPVYEPIGQTVEIVSSKPGYAGPVEVTVTFDETGVISDLIVGTNTATWAETKSIGGRCLDESFAWQFIGLAAPILKDDVDLITGATITSTAVVDAINRSYEKAFPADAAQTSPSVSPEASAAPLGAGVYDSSAPGYGGPVDVIVTFDDHGVIEALQVGVRETWAETESLGGQCRDEAFTAQFVGLSAPLSEDDVDLITGATVTSKAVVAAINKTYEKAFPAGSTTESK